MFKRVFLLLMITILLLSSIPAMAGEEPVDYKSTITVTSDGGKYQIGFVKIEFKKGFMEETKLSETFDIEIYAENGTAYIEFSPDISDFCKYVHIKVDSYDGVLYDRATGENVQVGIKRQQILADHFSRYAFQ